MKRSPLTILLAALGTSLLPAATRSPEDRKAMIEAREAAQPSQEALDRKVRSIRRLKEENVPTIEHLPVIEDTSSARVRTRAEIARRAIALCLVAAKGEGVEEPQIAALVEKYQAMPHFTPAERAFIENPSPSRQDRVQFSWRYECYWVALWTLGYVEKLERPDATCDVAFAVKLLLDRGPEKFIEGAKLRPIAEILDEADLIYRYNWACVDARVKRQEAPAKLHPGVVVERHHVLNWLIGYMNQEWDDVTTDT